MMIDQKTAARKYPNLHFVVLGGQRVRQDKRVTRQRIADELRHENRKKGRKIW
jgi:hypothetical protein